MTEKNTGGPAFPQERTLECGSHEECEGMTLRDYFAAKAMQAYLTHEIPANIEESITAGWAYAMADAMLKARGG